MIHVYATTEGPRGKSTELFQAVVQHSVRLNGKLLGEEAKKYGPATIREAQIAVSEVLGLLRSSILRLVRSMSNRLPSSKQKTDLVQEEF